MDEESCGDMEEDQVGMPGITPTFQAVPFEFSILTRSMIETWLAICFQITLLAPFSHMEMRIRPSGAR